MKPVTSLIFLLPLLCFIIALHLHVINGAGNLIENSCQGSEDKNLCNSTYNIAQSQNADLKGHARIGLNQASENATAISTYIKQKMGEPNLDPVVKQGLVDCGDLYLDAVDQVADSIAALEVDAFNDVPTWVEAAISDAVACQEVFLENPNADAKLTFDNGIFIKLCANILAVNNLLTGKQQ